MPAAGRLPMGDGFSTRIDFAMNPNVHLWEKTVTPPGMDGRGPVDITTMRNVTYTDTAPKKLITLTGFRFMAGYNPEVYKQLLAMINKVQLLTIIFPTDKQIKVYGWLDKFIPQEHSEGNMPLAECNVEPKSEFYATEGGQRIGPVYPD